MDLTVDEARLISVRRAIDKLNQPQLANIADSSIICAYITGIVDLDALEEKATSDQLEYFLDGCVLGFIISRLVEADITPDNLPKKQIEKEKQFQTGVDAKTGEVHIRKENQ